VDLVDQISARAGRFGLNLIAAVPAAQYDRAAAPDYRAAAIYPQCRSIVVLGNGGDALWRSFKAYSARTPGWSERNNPLDDFTRAIVEAEAAAPMRSTGIGYVTVYPFGSRERNLNFMQLAMMAGLAGPSIIGVVVHPVFGPWIAFRAALLVEIEIDRPGEATGFDPCSTCSSRACISACPAAAVSFPSGWDIPRCFAHRIEAHPQCADRCHARTACVLGPEYRYPDDELAYHQMRALRVMRDHYENRMNKKN
jgi:epoxyqueuosine reductase